MNAFWIFLVCFGKFFNWENFEDNKYLCLVTAQNVPHNDVNQNQAAAPPQANNQGKPSVTL